MSYIYFKVFFLTLSITISVFNRLTKSKITFTVMGNKVYFLVQITRKSGHRCASLTCITLFRDAIVSKKCSFFEHCSNGRGGVNPCSKILSEIVVRSGGHLTT